MSGLDTEVSIDTETEAEGGAFDPPGLFFGVLAIIWFLMYYAFLLVAMTFISLLDSVFSNSSDKQGDYDVK